MKQILIATNNENKVIEYRQIFSSKNIEVVSLLDLGITIESPEDGNTFEENSLQKAKFYYDIVKLPVISEDSGIEIINLDGFPGIKSKRWLESHSYEYKVNELLRLLDGKSSECRYVASITYYNGTEFKSFRGTCEGRLVKPTDIHGFGYDLGFYVEDKNNTLNNLSSEYKNSISHRRIATEKLLKWLK